MNIIRKYIKKTFLIPTCLLFALCSQSAMALVSLKEITTFTNQLIKEETLNGSVVYGTGHCDIIYSLGLVDNPFSKNAKKQLISSSADHTIRIWDVEKGTSEIIGTHSDKVNSVAVTEYVKGYKNGKTHFVSSSIDGSLQFWSYNHDLETISKGFTCNKFENEKEEIVKAKNAVVRLDASRVAFVTNKNTIGIFDWLYADLYVSLLEFGKKPNSIQELKGHKAWIDSIISLDEKGERIASASWDKTIKIWDTKTGECIKTFEGHEGPVNCVRQVTNDILVSGSDDKLIKLWDIKTDECKTLQGHLDRVYTLLTIPEEKLIISGSRDKTIKVWDLTKSNDEACVFTFDCGCSVRALAYSQKDGKLYVGLANGDIKVLSFLNEKE